MAKLRLDAVAFKRESCDSDCFLKDIVAYSSNSVVFLFDAFGIHLAYAPRELRISRLSLPFLRFQNPKIYYYFYPLSFCFDNFIIFMLFFWLSLRCRVDTIIMETYSAAFVGILRKCNLVKKMIYITSDWFVGNKYKRGIWTHVGSNKIFPILDYYACRFADITLNLLDFVAHARFDFWGKKITNKEFLFHQHLEIKRKHSDARKRNNKIVHIGEVRNDSGLDIVIKSLPLIREKVDVSLKVIGVTNTLHLYLKALARAYNVEKFVDLRGFIPRGNYLDELSDCVCGTNLLTSEGTFTSRSIPSKVVDYLQYLIPVAVSENVGPIAAIIRENNLGQIISPAEPDFIQAYFKIYENQEGIRSNIVAFINASPYTDLKSLFAGCMPAILTKEGDL